MAVTQNYTSLKLDIYNLMLNQLFVGYTWYPNFEP